MAVDYDAIRGRLRHSTEYWQLKIMDYEITLEFTKFFSITDHMRLKYHCLILKGFKMDNGINELASLDPHWKTVVLKRKSHQLLKNVCKGKHKCNF